MKVICRNKEVREGNFEEVFVKEAFWHTSAHVLAQAVKRLYPDAKCAIGPAIEKGFYYDFDFPFAFSDEHLQAIEDEMRKIVKETLTVKVYEMSREEALLYMKERKEDYKVEMIENRGGLSRSAVSSPARTSETVGRNDPCPCGSGKKYKNCCMLKDEVK